MTVGLSKIEFEWTCWVISSCFTSWKTSFLLKNPMFSPKKSFSTPKFGQNPRISIRELANRHPRISAPWLYVYVYVYLKPENWLVWTCVLHVYTTLWNMCARVVYFWKNKVNLAFFDTFTHIFTHFCDLSCFHFSCAFTATSQFV